MATVLDVDAAVRAVCPHIDGIGIGEFDDPTTWSIQACPEATPEELVAGQAVFDNWTDLPITPW